MDNMPALRENHPPAGQSWASIAKNQSTNRPRDNAALASPKTSGKMTLKLKNGKNGSNYKAGQGQQPAGPETPTFRGQYLEQMQAAEQATSRKPDGAKQVTIPAKDATTTASLATELATMKATVSTLQDDLIRRSNDLIEARAVTARKDTEIEALMSRIAGLEEDVKSATAAAEATEERFVAKEKAITKLEYENASLRDAIHTGIIAIGRVYGPGGAQAFTQIAEAEMDTMVAVSDGDANSPEAQPPQPVHQSPLPSASKETGDAPQRRVVQLAENGRTTENQKEIRPPKQARQQSAKSNRSVKGANDSANEAAKVQPTKSPQISIVPRSKGNKQVKEVKPAEDANNAHGQAQEDKGVSSSVKAISDLADVIDKASSPTTTQDNGAHGPTNTTAPVNQTSREENAADPEHKNADTSGSQGHGKESKEGRKDGKYAMKAQESTDIMDGVAAVRPDVKKTAPNVQKPGTEYHVYIINGAPKDSSAPSAPKTPGAPENRQSLPRNDSLTSGASLAGGDGAAEPKTSSNTDGWVDVWAKNKAKKQAKNKPKNKANRDSGTLEHTPAPDTNPSPTSTALVLRSNSPPVNTLKRKTKRPNGTVIGSNSIFSQLANKDDNEDHTATKKGDGQPGQLNQTTPNDRKESDTGSNGYAQLLKGQSKKPYLKGPQNRSSSAPQAINTTKKPQRNPPAAPFPGQASITGVDVGRSWAEEVEEASSRDPASQQSFW